MSTPPASSKTVDPPVRRPVVLVLMDAVYADLVPGIVEVARQMDWVLSVNQLRTPFHFSTRPADGLLLVATRPALAEWAGKRPEPKVAMLSPVAGRDWPVVEADWEAAGRAGAKHLLTLGDRNLAFLRYGGAPDTLAIQRGFLSVTGRTATLLWPGMEVDSPALPDLSPEERVTVLTRRLRQLSLPVAVMAEDDRFALDVLEAALRAGLRVPDDVAVLGSENLPLFQQISPIPLSSVDLRLPEIGRRAALLLDRLMQGGKVAEDDGEKVPPLGVVARASTASFDCAHAGVTLVVRHIRKNFRDALSLSDLAGLAGLSEAVLRREFKRHVGLPVHGEINRCRLCHAETLLRLTELKLSSIAADSGFRHPVQLWRLFKQSHGCSPQEWRTLSWRGGHSGRPELPPTLE